MMTATCPILMVGALYRRPLASALWLVFGLIATPAVLRPQTIAGRVTDVAGGPLAAVTISVDGTTLRMTTSDDGTYRIGGVPAGTPTVVARRVGYSPARKTVTVTSGEVTVDFQLTAAATSLEAVVTTATGQQRRIELGNTVAAIDVSARAATAPVKSIGDLLNGQATGVQVVPGTQTGTVSRIRVRGQSSTTLNNDPIYIIDGIRMTSTVGGANAGCGSCSTVSRVNDLNPEEIESIEIVKGPSAATLYGTDAANGVIVVTTKRGRAGPARWNFHAERGRVEDRNPYPANFALLGKSPGSTVQRRCWSYEIAAGQCTLDSAVSQNLWKDPELTPLKAGPRMLLGGQVSGGTSALRYFLSADRQEEDGPYGLPNFDRRRFDSLGVRIEDYVERPNYLKQYSFRANVNTAITPNLDVGVSSGLTMGTIRLVRNDPSGNGIWQVASVGPGYRAGPAYSGVNSRGWRLEGYFGETPGGLFQHLNQESANRFIGSTTVNWRPLTWLTANGDVGVDLTDRRVQNRQRAGETGGAPFSQDGRARILNFSTNFRGTATWQARDWAQLRSTAGFQTVAFDLNGTTATGTNLPPGGETPDQGSVFTVLSQSIPSRTIGAYLEEQVAIRNRLYVTGATRTDQNSAFGTNFQSVYYPKAAVSWIATDEDFFPSVPFLTQLRLRASLGSSGVQPRPTDAVRTYSTSSIFYKGTLATGLRLNNPGNPNLKPERSTELETGFDSQWWDERLNLELTYYRKQTKDALVNQPVAGSAGVNSFLVNLGGMRNAGIEYRLSAQLVDTREFGVDVSFAGSENRNKITSLGNIITTPTSANQVGRPVNSIFVRPIRYNDTDNNGQLSIAEVTVLPPDSAIFAGPQLPPVQMTLSGGAEFFQRRLRISTLFDRKAGAVQTNGELQFLCFVQVGCKPVSQLGTPLNQQAAAIAQITAGTSSGFVEKIDFIKWRELSASYDLGERMAGRLFRGQSARITAGIRNIKIWSDWSGIDPEAITANNSDALGTALTTGAPTYYMIRLNLTY